MDFTFTEDQKMLKAMVQDFATKELEPIALETTAVRRDNGYVINGNKIFITNGAASRCYLGFCYRG